MQRFTCDICGRDFFGVDNRDGQLLCFTCGAELADEITPVINPEGPMPSSVLDEFDGGRGDDQ